MKFPQRRLLPRLNVILWAHLLSVSDKRLSRSDWVMKSPAEILIHYLSGDWTFYLNPDYHFLVIFSYLGVTNLISQAVGWDSWVPSALKSILWGTLFLKQLHDFSLLSWISFLDSFLELKFTKKKFLDTKKKFIFEGRFLLTTI